MQRAITQHNTRQYQAAILSGNTKAPYQKRLYTHIFSPRRLIVIQMHRSSFTNRCYNLYYQPWKGRIVDECTGLENRNPALRDREFESRPFRHFSLLILIFEYFNLELYVTRKAVQRLF